MNDAGSQGCAADAEEGLKEVTHLLESRPWEQPAASRSSDSPWGAMTPLWLAPRCTCSRQTFSPATVSSPSLKQEFLWKHRLGNAPRADSAAGHVCEVTAGRGPLCAFWFGDPCLGDSWEGPRWPRGGCVLATRPGWSRPGPTSWGRGWYGRKTGRHSHAETQTPPKIELSRLTGEQKRL